ncbi:MAG: hypothetical protein E3J72_16265 [Planctomycetota bacterium]|nr:MAG: hypothetical protein E3J72_16265 [Planctomycetota bacterium]
MLPPLATMDGLGAAFILVGFIIPISFGAYLAAGIVLFFISYPLAGKLFDGKKFSYRLVYWASWGLSVVTFVTVAIFYMRNQGDSSNARISILFIVLPVYVIGLFAAFFFYWLDAKKHGPLSMGRMVGLGIFTTFFNVIVPLAVGAGVFFLMMRHYFD